MSLTLVALFCGIAYICRKCLMMFASSLTSPLRKLPGPPKDNILLGNLRPEWILGKDHPEVRTEWLQKYGDTLVFSGLFSVPVLLSTDVCVISHILTHSDAYLKPDETRYTLSRLANGLLVAEGDIHRYQRKLMNHAFGPAQISEITLLFFEKSWNLRDAWCAELVKEEPSAQLDVSSWIHRVTLDMIGIGGLNRDFDSLSGRASEDTLYAAFSKLYQMAKPDGFRLAQALLPLLRKATDPRYDEIFAELQSISRQLVEEKKRDIMEELKDPEIVEAEHPRDILTLLLKANMTNDASESQPLQDAEILNQIPTLIAAGFQPTSSTVTWCLTEIARIPEVQQKLRSEVLRVPQDVLTMEELIAMPYLDKVVKESLRLHPPVTMAERVAAKDDSIPVSKPLSDRNGMPCDTIRIAKGDRVHIPILHVNSSKAIWGDDADIFRPDRWEDLPEAVTSVPGVWSHLLTFLDGPRACVGYRFAIVGVKVLLFTLVRAFEFELAEPVANAEIQEHHGSWPHSNFARDDLNSSLEVRFRVKARRRASLLESAVFSTT